MINVKNMAANIASLQATFGKLDRMDPTGPLATKMRAMIKKVDNADALRIIYRAEIKWVSTFALTQLIIRGEKV